MNPRRLSLFQLKSTAIGFTGIEKGLGSVFGQATQGMILTDINPSILLMNRVERKESDSK